MIDFLKTNSPVISPEILAKISGARFLVTGASGLIGLNFITALLKARDEGLDVEITAIVSSSRPVLTKELREQGVTVLRVNLANLNQQLQFGEFDYILHAASYGQPGKFLQDKLATITLNTTALQRLGALMTNSGRLLYMSTSEIYSGLEKPAFDEGDIGVTSPQHPRACYIEAKRAGETICEAFTELGVSAVSVRLALAYGPGVWADDKRVLNQFIQKGLLGGQIDMLDAGLDSRTYGHVSDVTVMLFNILVLGKRTLYNVGGESSVSIRELAEMVGRQLNVPIHAPALAEKVVGAPTAVSLSLNRYKSEFGEINFTEMEVGLAKTIQWYKKIYGEA